MLARRQRSFWRDQQGSALIEGAAMIPLLIALVTGVFEFSWFFYQQHLVTIGLHDAADYLARSSDPCNPASPIWKAEQAHAGQCGDRIRANRSGLCRPTRWTNADDQRLLTEFAVSIFLSARSDGLSRSSDSGINGFDDGPGLSLACALILSLLPSAWIR